MSAGASDDAAGAVRAGGRRPKDTGDGNPFSRLIAAIVRFVRQVIAELKKVVTPTRNEWATFVVVVLVFVLAIVAYVGVLDFLIGKLLFWAFAHYRTTNEQSRALVSEQPDAAGSQAPAGVQAPAEPETTVDEPQVDPEEALRRELRGLDGDWYVIHSYAGYENRVKANLESRITSLNMEDYIFQVEVPMEEVVEIKNAVRKLVKRVRIPSYVLVRMEMTAESWGAVLHTPGVTGFVGNANVPVPLTLNAVV